MAPLLPDMTDGPQQNVNKYPTIGIILWNLTYSYQAHLAGDFRRYAEKHGIKIIIIQEVSFVMREKNGIRIKEFLSVIKKEKVNGIILTEDEYSRMLCSALVEIIEQQELHLPVITLGYQEGSIPGVIIDNEKGMRDILNHLIHDHSYTHFAFIKGSGWNQDYRHRHRLFLQILDENKITITDDCIITGSNSPEQVTEVVIGFIEKGITCDVIVASDDEFAASVMAALQCMRISVPKDIAVTGFDDTPLSTQTHPRITTVRQPYYQLIGRAMELVLEYIHGKKPPLKTVLKPTLVIRGSCGCHDTTGYNKVDGKETPGSRDKVIISYNKVHVLNYEDEDLEKIITFISRHYMDETLTVKKIQEGTGVPLYKIPRIIKEHCDLTFKQLLNTIRISEAKRLLCETDRNILDISLLVGFTNRMHFCRVFKKSEGISPTQFRTGTTPGSPDT